MGKPEIVSPGGSYEKAIVAAKYWADAVYVWVPFLSLRMRQNKIKDFDLLKKTVDDLHKLGKKAYLTINIFPRNIDIKIIESTIEKIADVWADSVIFSDPWVFVLLKKYFKNKVKYHLSTQTNTLNWMSVKFWYDQGVDRIILARELNIKEILEIKQKVSEIELEAFVHGAMCMTYSGRCLLWEYFAGRDWNKGECSHVCRYKFNVYVEEEKRPWKLLKVEEDETGSFLFSSKDLCTIDHWKELIEAIDAWKIEWRSKSEFYVAATTLAYSHLRDYWWQKRSEEAWEVRRENPVNPVLNPEILNLVYQIPHRQYWDGFLFNDLKKNYPETEEIETTTKTEAWPLPGHKNYVWTLTDENFEKDGKIYYGIAPKTNIFPGDKFDVLDYEDVWKKTKIIDVLNENKEPVEKLTCNFKKAYVCGENLRSWNILVK